MLTGITWVKNSSAGGIGLWVGRSVCLSAVDIQWLAGADATRSAGSADLTEQCSFTVHQHPRSLASPTASLYIINGRYYFRDFDWQLWLWSLSPRSTSLSLSPSPGGGANLLCNPSSVRIDRRQEGKWMLRGCWHVGGNSSSKIDKTDYSGNCSIYLARLAPLPRIARLYNCSSEEPHFITAIIACLPDCCLGKTLHKDPGDMGETELVFPRAPLTLENGGTSTRRRRRGKFPRVPQNSSLVDFTFRTQDWHCS